MPSARSRFSNLLERQTELEEFPEEKDHFFDPRSPLTAEQRPIQGHGLFHRESSPRDQSQNREDLAEHPEVAPLVLAVNGGKHVVPRVVLSDGTAS
jgi:hypothetical protein